MARRVLVRRLNSVDLPTLGRPTSTTDGSGLDIDDVGFTGGAVAAPARGKGRQLTA
jgi:hypothetical protein